MPEVVEIYNYRIQKENLPEFTLDYQRTMLLNFLEKRSGVGYTNIEFALLELSSVDFRFIQGIYFTEKMKNKLLFPLALDKKIELRTRNKVDQIRQYLSQPKKSCGIYEILLDARTKANIIWDL